MNNEYGYIGGSTINQKVKNDGILSVNDAHDLQTKGHLGGSLQRITEASFTSSSLIAVTNTAHLAYDVHYLKINFGQGSTHDVTTFIDFSTDGGSSYEGADYDYGYQYGQSNNSSSGTTSTGTYGIILGQSLNSYDRNYYVGAYIYNMGVSSKSTSVSVLGFGSRSGSETYRYMYGGGQSDTSAVHNAFKIIPNTGNLTGSYQLYGVKEV